MTKGDGELRGVSPAIDLHELLPAFTAADVGLRGLLAEPGSLDPSP